MGNTQPNHSSHSSNESYKLSNQSEYKCDKDGKNAICVLYRTNGESVFGHVGFHQCNRLSPVQVIFRLKGPTYQTHAIHIHEYGDLTNGCDSMGLHFNPTKTTHGSRMYNMQRHAGDLINNIKFDQFGNFSYEYEDSSISLFDETSIIGRSIVIHQGEDDLGRGTGDRQKESLISGNAGKRINCGIIGIAKTIHM
jgi:superoxide dismutase, Cu-Zn family